MDGMGANLKLRAQAAGRVERFAMDSNQQVQKSPSMLMAQVI
jgi:hypothetical protein